MIQCDLCDKKLVTPKQMENHKAKEHNVELSQPEEVLAPVVETVSTDLLQPEVVTPEVSEPASDKIILRFSKPVQVRINGIAYPEVEGKVIEVSDVAVASEIVRILREAYGDILER